MKSNIFQIIGASIYTIFAVFIFIVVVSSGMPVIFASLIIMALLSGFLYAMFILFNGVLGALLPIKDKEYNKKNDKYALHNDFTDMLNGSPKEKD